MTDPAGVRAGYDRVAATYADQVGDELAHRPLERALLAALPDLAGLDESPGLVGDLGSGPGHVGRHLRSLGFDVVALDLSPAMAAIARARNDLPALAGSLTALPLADQSLGAAVALFALIHLDDAALIAAAGELARVLRPEGIALVSFHVGEDVHHVEQWWGERVDIDFRFFTVARITALLETAGLRVEATLERQPMPAIEAQTIRAYVLARRQRD